MTNYKEIIRLHANGFSMRSIARALGCHRSTISSCLERAEKEEIQFPVAAEITNEQLHELLYPKQFI